MPKHFAVISLFSGGMGLDIGLEQTGQFRHLACVEKIPAFCETIRRNRDAGRIGSRDLKVYEKDIAEPGPDQVMRDLGIAPGIWICGRSGWWRRLTLDLPSPTIVTMPNHAGTALCHPTETRALTLRECARVQEFPDDWEFCGTTQQQYTQVGNAVPVRLGRVCGELVARELADLDNNQSKKAEDKHPSCRIVYVKSHIRTRKWFKAGKAFVWRAGEENSQNKYRAAKTERRVKLPPKE